MSSAFIFFKKIVFDVIISSIIPLIFTFKNAPFKKILAPVKELIIDIFIGTFF